MKTLYSEMFSHFKTGDLVIWDTRKNSSFLTIVLYLYQKIFGARYTHVGMIVKKGEFNYVIESVPPFVRLFPLRLTGDFYWIPVKLKGKEKSLLSVLNRKIGNKYSYLDLLKTYFGIKGEKNTYYCSELVADIYYEFDVINDHRVGRDPDSLVNEIMSVTGKGPMKIEIDKGALECHY